MAKLTRKWTEISISGIGLLVGCIFTMAGYMLHPQDEAGRNRVAEAAYVIQRHMDTWYPAHIFLLLLSPILAWSFFVLYRRLKEKGQSTLALPGLILMITYSIFSGFALTMDGFMLPVLAQNFINASGTTKDAAFVAFTYNQIEAISLLLVAFFSFVISLILYGIALLRAKVYAPWLAWSGIIIGLIGVVGYFAGFFQHYWVDSAYFPLFAIVFTIWLMILGIFMTRDKSEL